MIKKCLYIYISFFFIVVLCCCSNGTKRYCQYYNNNTGYGNVGEEYLYLGGDDTKNVIIPNMAFCIDPSINKKVSVTGVASGAYYKNEKIEKISMKESMFIGPYAFYNCGNLMIVEGLTQATYIKEYAFYNTKINTDNGKIILNSYEIGSYAFANVEGLNYIVLQNEISISVGEKAFLNSSITNIYINTTNYLLLSSNCFAGISNVEFGGTIQELTLLTNNTSAFSLGVDSIQCSDGVYIGGNL